MRNLHIVKKAVVSFTADDWQLYDKTPASVVSALNKTLQAALNTDGATPSYVSRAMDPVLDKYAKYGAADSEGYATVEQAARAFFKQ